jgi:5-methylcytosine-specific restriction protein B
VGWNLTMGLYWIRPWNFPTLDGQSQRYISKKLNIQIGMNGPKSRCNATDYLAVLDTLEARFQEDAYPVHSFPELSLAAWLFKDSGTSAHPNATDPDAQDDEADATSEAEVTAAPIEPYSVDDILTDGCFIAREKLEKILERLRTKKNLILQGPPGTGKTWLAKRLAFALMGQRDDSKVRAVQFHPNLSYEDFIRGWRPAGDGKLTLVDGPFVEMMKAAAKDPTSRYVVVIEEINRGNPAQIFGEMLTLLEVDKRTPNEALELSYKRSDGERVFIPDNLYVIGTMNIADRSLALVDLALRRRFAFIDLEPTFGKPWRDWVQSQCSIDSEILVEIEKRLIALNSEISADTGLGPQFRVGHSYVTPPFGIPISDAREWFRQVVDTEIGPLLDEYWFDALEKSQQARERLLEGF